MLKMYVVGYIPREISILLHQNYVQHCPLKITFNIGGFSIGSHNRVNNYKLISSYRVISVQARYMETFHYDTLVESIIITFGYNTMDLLRSVTLRYDTMYHLR